MVGKITASTPQSEGTGIQHINRQIPPLAHAPMHVWHKFWSRKTWNVVAEHIKCYCPEGGVVLDPFAGSGVTAMEALRNGRRAIVCDILPVATEIIRLTIQPVNIEELQKAFRRVERRVRNRIERLYMTKCRKCGAEFPFTCAVWDAGELEEIRYEQCPKCGDRREQNCPPTSSDIALLRQIESRQVKEWYPRNRLYYPDGRAFKEKQQYESLDQLFTKRNLQALAWLMDAIEKEPNPLLRDFLKIAFTSMVHLCSRLAAAGRPGYRPFSGVGWNQQSYWYTPLYLESNIWLKFESAIFGPQGLLRGKEESNEYFANKRMVKTLRTFLKGTGHIYIHTGDCLRLMKQMPDGCVNYIFTDPPYASSIQFGELAYLWVAWLKKDKGYLDSLLRDEVVENLNQGKSFDFYIARVRTAFDEMFRVLKRGGWLTVTFHNPTLKVRNATIRAGHIAGFDFEHIHLQELARPSAKSLLQPYGSAHGDFYLRFRKPAAVRTLTAGERTADKFERVVVDAVIQVLAERGEATPKYVIDNYVDPILSRNGFFPSIEVDGKTLSVDEVLKRHEGQEFIKVPMEVGGHKGYGWWLKNPQQVKNLEKIPLSERVDQAIIRLLMERGKATFTEALEKVFTEFPNSLTTDSTSVKEALERYGNKRGSGSSATYVLKPVIRQTEREHDQIIGHLAEIGRALGYGVWIGMPEQSRTYPRKNKPLSEWVTADLNQVDNVLSLEDAERVDCLWVSERKIVYSFDVDRFTPLMESLRRGASISEPVKRYLVLPDERHTQFQKRLKNPLFNEDYEKYGWDVLYFSALQSNFKSLKAGKKTIEEIAGSPPENPHRNPEVKPTKLFDP